MSREIFKNQENPMRRLRLGKVIVHIATGKSGEPLEKAKKILEELTGQRPAIRRAKRTIKDFGIRRGEPIACMVTLRGLKAEEFLRRALEAVDHKLSAASFDGHGNVAFGIKEHIEIPGTSYRPELGITGLDVAISLERPGYRVKLRRRRAARIGKKHLVTKEDAMGFLKEAFGVEVAEG